MKGIIKFGLILFLIGSIVGALGYQWIYTSNTNLSHDYELFIPQQTTFAELQEQLKQDSVLSNHRSFETVAMLMKYGKDQIPTGKYIIKPGQSNRDILNILRAGLQSPINLTISNGRYLEDIISKVSHDIEPDSIQLESLLRDSAFINSLGFNKDNVISLFIPDTYELYWNTTPEKFISKMKSEYDRFWNSDNRQAKLSSLGMSQYEVATLASIVEKETNSKTERPTIAGVYLNRMNKGIKLQADPTVVYGVGDFSIRRVLHKHLKHDSPYNTYLYEGLPPGPICMPSKSSLDAVLNAEKHDYIFFCAKPGYNGEHLFAVTNAQHERNANTYRRWLTKERIMK